MRRPPVCTSARAISDLLELARQRLHDVRLAAHQRLLDVALQRRGPVGLGAGGRILAQLRREIADLDRLARRHHGEPVADVLELAHVALPVLRDEIVHRAFGEALRLDAQIARALGEEVAGEQRHVLAPLAQGSAAGAGSR